MDGLYGNHRYLEEVKIATIFKRKISCQRRFKIAQSCHTGGCPCQLVPSALFVLDVIKRSVETDRGRRHEVINDLTKFWR